MREDLKSVVTSSLTYISGWDYPQVDWLFKLLSFDPTTPIMKRT
jgi:hypothetical protein